MSTGIIYRDPSAKYGTASKLSPKRFSSRGKPTLTALQQTIPVAGYAYGIYNNKH